MTTRPTTDLDEATALRHQLADELAAAGHIRTPAVDRALRTVPRHAFAPETPLHAAYANEIIATRHSDDGTVISSISAPWLQADMLEAARIQPGHHALEIGSGGYNAALIAELAGPTGHVTTLDIDPAVTDRATRFLTQAGYGRIRVVTADAEHLPAEVVPDGGFDAIVVTVDTWDLPWIDALAEGGRLVAPVRLHGYHWAISFTKHDGALHSDEPLIVCGFVAMQGDGAWHRNRRTVPGTGVHLSWEDGNPLPVDELAPALTETRTDPGAGPHRPAGRPSLNRQDPFPISADHRAHRALLRHLDHYVSDSKKIHDAWDAYSDEHTDLDGWPYDDHAYGRRASQRDADTAEAFEPLRYGVRHLLATAETQLAHLPETNVQSRWVYQLGVLRDALDRLDELHEQWLVTRDALPATAKPGTPDFDDALAAHHAESWSYLDDWATHGKALREINTAARKAPSPLAPTPTPAPATAPDRRATARK
ncbi:methyltransferase domain-containing protein [Streptomyces albidocamelliae]|uniref:Protein-L-isoaspartate O-methyltransferase n=1 Tax=Streptomyces albidocamelliae TaxID=2981135 RepID=A0ABY6EHN7_9ACTN|nr:methyltransferase domain-containing protein [Streptomyces sp. HUAS 14-6]UXY34400.1 methyltransferase domain-containing protein [Streptomyces sp. HUAS 14-6]